VFPRRTLVGLVVDGLCRHAEDARKGFVNAFISDHDRAVFDRLVIAPVGTGHRAVTGAFVVAGLPEDTGDRGDSRRPNIQLG